MSFKLNVFKIKTARADFQMQEKDVWNEKAKAANEAESVKWTAQAVAATLPASSALGCNVQKMFTEDRRSS